MNAQFEKIKDLKINNGSAVYKFYNMLSSFCTLQHRDINIKKLIGYIKDNSFEYSFPSFLKSNSNKYSNASFFEVNLESIDENDLVSLSQNIELCLNNIFAMIDYISSGSLDKVIDHSFSKYTLFTELVGAKSIADKGGYSDEDVEAVVESGINAFKKCLKTDIIEHINGGMLKSYISKLELLFKSYKDNELLNKVAIKKNDDKGYEYVTFNSTKSTEEMLNLSNLYRSISKIIGSAAVKKGLVSDTYNEFVDLDAFKPISTEIVAHLGLIYAFAESEETRNSIDNISKVISHSSEFLDSLKKEKGVSDLKELKPGKNNERFFVLDVAHNMLESFFKNIKGEAPSLIGVVSKYSDKLSEYTKYMGTISDYVRIVCEPTISRLSECLKNFELNVKDSWTFGTLRFILSFVASLCQNDFKSNSFNYFYVVLDEIDRLKAARESKKSIWGIFNSKKK